MTQAERTKTFVEKIARARQLIGRIEAQLDANIDCPTGHESDAHIATLALVIEKLEAAYEWVA